MKQIAVVTIIIGSIVCALGVTDPFNWIRGYGYMQKETALMLFGGVVALIGLGLLVYGVNKKN